MLDPPGTFVLRQLMGRYVLKGYTPGASYNVKFIDVPASTWGSVIYLQDRQSNDRVPQRDSCKGAWEWV